MRRQIALCLILALLFAFPAWNAIAEDVEGLVLYISFDEEGDPVDHSPDPTEAFIRGTLTSVEGQFGKALEFDGNPANYVEVDHAAKLEGMVALTIEAWTKQNSVTGHSAIVSKRLGYGNLDVYNLGAFGGAEMTGRINGNAGQGIESMGVLENGRWYHVTYIFDGNAAENERQKLYMDGELEATVAHPDDSVAEGGAPLWMGLQDPNKAPALSGVLDEVRIWNRALSEDEIKLAMDGTMIMPVEFQGKLATTWSEMKR